MVVRAVAWSVARLPGPLHDRRFRPSRRAVLVAWVRFRDDRPVDAVVTPSGVRRFR